MEGANPFADPSVRQVASDGQPVTTGGGLDTYNPFDDKRNSQSAVIQPTPPGASVTTAAHDPPPPYAHSPATTAAAVRSDQVVLDTEAIRKRQEELDRKERELQSREEELRRTSVGAKEHNWPPLPSWSPVQPCFYHDIGVDIAPDYQQIVRFLYYDWILHIVTYLLNFLGALSYFIGDSAGATVFGLSILYLILFTPCSLLCWYRPVYKAFRNDSSFMFMIFFFIFAAQIVADFLFCLGINALGTCGWINGLSMVDKSTVTAVIMFIVALAFTTLLVFNLYLIVKVHRLYRTTGASFKKAQEEFAQGVARSEVTRNIASEAVRTGVSGAAGGGGGGGPGRY